MDLIDNDNEDTLGKRKRKPKVSSDFINDEEEISRLSKQRNSLKKTEEKEKEKLKHKEEKLRLKLEGQANAAANAHAKSLLVHPSAPQRPKKSKPTSSVSATTSSSAPTVKLTAKLKEEIEREEKLIEDYQKRLSKLRSTKLQPLPQGPWVVGDLSEAINCGATQSRSLLLDWTIPEVKKIGMLCFLLICT